MSDPGTSYRSRDEIQEVRQTRDPITSFREKITSAGLVTSEELKVKISKNSEKTKTTLNLFLFYYRTWN